MQLTARITSLAAISEILVSRTVRDLIIGSELRFTDRGEHELKGIPRAPGALRRRKLSYGDCPSCSALLNPVAAEALARLEDRDGARTYADAAALVAGMFRQLGLARDGRVGVGGCGRGRG